MLSWSLTPFDVARPELTRLQTEEDRRVLEMRTAENLVYILRTYGSCEEAAVDLGVCDDVEECATFYTLSVEPTLLEDDSELHIGQLPYHNLSFSTEPGMHSIHIEDEDGAVLYNLVVRDPVLGNVKNLVTYADDTLPPISELSEIGDALQVLIISFEQTGTGKNELEHDTASYPIPKSDDEFDRLTEHF